LDVFCLYPIFLSFRNPAKLMFKPELVDDS
jgi:hypothetical protein